MFFNFDSKWDSTGTRYKEESSNGQKLNHQQEKFTLSTPQPNFYPPLLNTNYHVLTSQKLHF